MSALHKLAMAFVTVIGGIEVVVLDAVPSPVHDDLMVAETLTIGALAVGAGVALWLATAFGAGQSGPARHDDAVAAPDGIPPWERPELASIRTRPATLAPEPVRTAEVPPVRTPMERRNVRLADAWRQVDATGEQLVLSDETALMTVIDFAELDDAPHSLIDVVEAYGVARDAVPSPAVAAVPPSEREYPELADEAPTTVWTVEPAGLSGQGVVLHAWFGNAFKEAA